MIFQVGICKLQLHPQMIEEVGLCIEWFIHILIFYAINEEMFHQIKKGTMLGIGWTVYHLPASLKTAHLVFTKAIPNLSL